MSEYIEHDKDEISVGIVEKQLFTFGEPPDEIVLESGNRFGPVTLAYETCGTLNEEKSNVILILHAQEVFVDLFLIIKVCYGHPLRNPPPIPSYLMLGVPQRRMEARFFRFRGPK